jgi:hypothetical protein
LFENDLPDIIDSPSEQMELVISMTKSADGEGDFGPKCGGNSFVSSAMMILFEEAAASTGGWRNQPDVEFMRHSRCDSR